MDWREEIEKMLATEEGRKSYEEYRKVALDPEYIRETNEYFDKIDQFNAKILRRFHNHYLDLCKIISENEIFCYDSDDIYQYNFYVVDTNHLPSIRARLESFQNKLKEEFDKETKIPYFRLDIISMDEIKEKEYYTGKEYFEFIIPIILDFGE